MEHNNFNSIRDKVLETINAGAVTMRPKWHFILRTTSLTLGVVLVTLTVLYLSSFIVFSLRQSGALVAPGFGWHGASIFLQSLPWVLIIIACILLVLLEILVRKYEFAYGRPLIYSVLGVMVLAVVGGFIVEMTPLHRGLFTEAESQRLPMAGQFYRIYGERRVNNVVVGEIIEVTPVGYDIIDRTALPIAVILTPDTRLPRGRNFNTGDMIVVLGQFTNRMVIAEGIMPFDGMRGPSPLRVPYERSR